MLIVNDISKKVKNHDILKETSFNLNNGVVGLLGPNGAGKTTLLRILSTYFEPTTGTISLGNLNWDKNKEEIRKHIGYMPQHIGLFPHLKIIEYLQYIGILRGMALEQIKELALKTLIEVNLEDKANIKIKNLSGGMKQRVGIAQAIMHNPQLLIVDEPTAGLDPEERIRFRNLLKRIAQERIVLFSTHITEDIVMTCDEVLLMNKGTVMKYSHVQDVVSIANQLVWTVTVDSTAYNSMLMKKEFFISNITEEPSSNQITLRIIHNEQPHPLAVQIHPTLEEGYMVWLQKS
ncbi:ATP-binding cassette domain-containing protein [Lysinibacillus agricola]|uniref:ATP-binding cassette domain-containing protein n=1 Tax=Lysinibacillus agricola TaxID=2590012 RepID=A0ABX7ARV1_9BACI|nr:MULTISPECIES: ATP-binding cassette domain-containing protein [Lysinibacillus]KOS61079.1 hypothetical protein AN161_19035 [Lysinibacillus sp. FJAT-14222]QQP12549.1 ATP-binding cassette domain-containing protein [Lysinibacillus agricola]